MALPTFLEPIHLLETLALALSIFNLVAFLWLTFTVWLNGNRAAWITRIGVVGLGLSALFFFLHALLIFIPLPSTPNAPGLFSLDFWWHFIWIPAIGVPYIWFAIGLHYAALMNEGWRRRRPLLLVSSGLLGILVFLLLILNASTFTFIETLRLLAYNTPLSSTNTGIFSPVVLLPLLFLCYVTVCAIGPWFTLGRFSRILRVLWHATFQKDESPARLPLRRALVYAFWDDPVDEGYRQARFHGEAPSTAPMAAAPGFQPLQEPVLSWYLARPGLLLAALLMVCLTTTLGILGIHSMIEWLEHPLYLPSTALPSFTTIPLNLIILDLCANGGVGLIILLIGYSIVRHGILIERPLARRGFFEQWRGIVIVATTVALFIAFLVTFTRSNLGGLLLITSLATAAYALFTWSSYTAHDRYVALLGPFLRSTSLRHWLNTDQHKTELDLENLFIHLCSDVLVVQCARLTILAGPVRRSFSYRWPEKARVGGIRSGHDAHRIQFGQITLRGKPMICWVVPIYDERGPVATLYLGPRQDGAAFTDEDMNLAQACGQRILDTIGDHEAMQAVADLLRRRIVDVKLLDAQQRRILHDEILPQMHLALLHLETLRTLHTMPLTVSSNQSNPVNSQNMQYLQITSPDTSANGTHLGALNGAEQGLTDVDTPNVLNEAIERISDAHRRLAAMMRATALTSPHRLERDGLMAAIRTMLEQDFQNSFDEVTWSVSDETAACIDEITPPAIAELIFAAVQEALRNAARHARGTDVHRRLSLLFKASCNPHLEVIVADDGVGIASAVGIPRTLGVDILEESSYSEVNNAPTIGGQSAPGEMATQIERSSAFEGVIKPASTSGTGGGLLTHSALLAIAGGSLTIKSITGEGVTIRILLPRESLRHL